MSLAEGQGPAGRGLVIAAHGSRAEPAVNARVHALARRVGRASGFDAASGAFHQGDPGFGRVLDEMRCAEFVVVPLLTSEGWFASTVLPRELARNRVAGRVAVRRTRAAGAHPRLPDLVVARVTTLVDALDLARPAVAIVGHGTTRHPSSRDTSDGLAAHLHASTGLEARAFFLDDDPAIEQVRHDFARGDLLVLPFLLGGGRHAVADVRERLGLRSGEESEVVMAGLDGRRVVLDRPLGLDPGFEDLVEDLARRAWAQRAAGALAAPDSSSTT